MNYNFFVNTMLLQANKIYHCKINRINPTFLIISIETTQGICHISEVSDYHINSLNNFFKVGETYPFLLLEIEPNGKCKFSYKRIHPKLLKHHREIIESISGYVNLYKNTIKLLDK